MGRKKMKTFKLIIRTMGTTTTTAAAQKLSWIKCVVMRAEASKTHTLHIIYICTHTQTQTPRHTYTHANKPTNQSTLTPASVTLHTCTHTHSYRDIHACISSRGYPSKMRTFVHTRTHTDRYTDEAKLLSHVTSQGNFRCQIEKLRLEK